MHGTMNIKFYRSYFKLSRRALLTGVIYFGSVYLHFALRFIFYFNKEQDA